MYPKLRDDRERLPALLATVSAYAAGVLERLDTAPVVVAPRTHTATILAPSGVGAEGALQHFKDWVAASLSASAGPRYLGFVTGGTTPAALLGDWLAAVFDQNPISWLDGSTALQLERDTLAMLRALFGLPEPFAGSFVSGATMANFVGLALAREWVGRVHGIRVSDEGLATLPRLEIFAATPHSSTTKALAMLGLGRAAWQGIACLPGREAMDLTALESLLAAAAGPCVVIASAGTVNTGDFDDFSGLTRLKERYGFWLHVDAAFGGFASLSPALQPLLRGWECADSICIDLHKWLNVPYDSAVAFTRHRDLQGDVFANVSAYLGRSAQEPEPIHLAPENSHRWRALPAWFSLLAYGAEGYREIVERDCQFARTLGERIAESEFFQLLAPVRLNIVCFAPRDRALSAPVIAAVRDSGATFVTPTVLHGTPAIRAAFSNWRTTDQDLDVIWEALVNAAKTTRLVYPDHPESGGEAMTESHPMIFHLVIESDFQAQFDGRVYLPAGLRRDGFVHCALAPSVIPVANDYYAEAPGRLLLLEIDPQRLVSETRYEPAAPIAGGGTAHLASASLFPHVYGPINTEAITGVGVLGRTLGGYAWPQKFMSLRLFRPQLTQQSDADHADAGCA